MISKLLGDCSLLGCDIQNGQIGTWPASKGFAIFKMFCGSMQTGPTLLKNPLHYDSLTSVYHLEVCGVSFV